MTEYSVFGNLVIYLHSNDSSLLINGKAQLELTASHEFKNLEIFGNAILIDLTFKGDAILHITFDNCAQKSIIIKRFHSKPFPQKGGFCVSTEIKTKGSRYALLPEKIDIYSSDYLEHSKIGKKGNYIITPIHNLNKAEKES